MNPGQRRSRGIPSPAPAEKSNLTATDPSLVPLDDLRDELARVLDGAFVLVVKTTGGRHRRRAFLTAAAAEKAAYKANQAGHNATVYLAQLKPLFRLIGGAS